MDYTKFLDFTRFCNEYIDNETDYAIGAVLIQKIDSLNSLTISDIALESNTSTASVSRFIRKMGFQSLNDFRYEMPQDKANYKNLLMKLYMQRFQNKNKSDIQKQLLKQATDNLSATKEKLDHKKIDLLIQKMLAADSISLLGDSREVRTFYTFQLGMMMLNKPVFAFSRSQIALQHCKRKKENSLNIFFCLSKEWLSEEWINVLRTAHTNGEYIVIFTQDDIRDANSFSDMLISYGIPNSYNMGYYSLSFLNDLLYSLAMKETNFNKF